MQDAGSRTTHGDLGTVRDYASSEHPITTIQNNMQSRVDVECHTDRRAAVCTEMTGNGSSMKLHQYRVISLPQPQRLAGLDVPDSLEYRFLRRLKSPIGAMAAGREQQQ